MKVIITAFTLFSLIASLNGQETNVYESIVKRNAFNLTGEVPMKILPPISEILAPNVYLTGITRLNGVRKVHLVLRKTGNPDEFISLATNEKRYNVELKEILENSAYISTNGQHRLLSFEKHALPSIITKKATPKKDSSSNRYSRDKKEDKGEKKSSPQSPRAQVVKVPSRSSQIAPRIIEKGLEYLSRMEEGEKRDYLLKRMESLQSGQHQLKSDIDQNERRRQYDEYRRRRDK